MYNILDTKTTNELYLTRHGWFSPEYELTDNAYSYGKLAYNGLSRRKALVTTAAGTWVFKYEDLFGRKISITDQSGALIGEASRDWFSRKVLLTLQTGFRAEFYRPSLFSREYVWQAEEYGAIMHINSYLLNLKDTVYIDQSTVPAALMPLLAFLGTHLIILSRRRRRQ